MTSVQRYYAQRNTNSNQIIPVYGGVSTESIGFADISGSVYYTLNIPKVQYTGGTYYVDMSDVDSEGNLLDLTGQFVAGGNSIFNVNFIVNIEAPASYYTNMDVTIYFKNIPLNRLPYPFFTIGLVKSEDYPFPYILSAPMPLLTAPNLNPSLTIKSDGTDYTVVSSGPAGWMGSYLLGTLVSSIAPPG